MAQQPQWAFNKLKPLTSPLEDEFFFFFFFFFQWRNSPSGPLIN
jgi:hypothetical protein